ncbi:hypothetical protein [Aeoliella sp.]|uniref:hypothetical protein n=1 Tax=Aeoliella sp. TaxID=2795800 RepID=UPI003CCBCAEE
MIEWLQNDASIQLLKNIAMVLFFVVFSGVVLWLLLRKNSEIRRWSRIPLEDSAVHDQSHPKDEDGQSP